MSPKPEPVPLLLVDDTPANLLALEAILESPDYRLVTAASGPEALDKVAGDDFALILLDVAMPGLTGFDVADRLKQDERTRHIPILFLTAVATGLDEIYRAYQIGAVDYLVKPLNVAAVRSKVRVFADLWRREREAERRERRLREAEAREHEVRVAALRAASDQRYRKLVDGIDHAFGWTAQAQGLRLTFLSRRAHDLLGYAAPDVVHHGFLLERVHPDDRDAVSRAIATAVVEQHDVTVEHRFVAGDGSARWFHTAVNVDADRDTGRIQLHGLSIDVDDLKRTAERNRRLAHENKRLYEKADRSARAREEILQVVSHDLRTPLGAVMMAVQRARGVLASHGDPSKVEASLATAERATGTMRRLVDDLLDEEAIETGRLSLREQPHEVSLLLAEAVALVHERARARGIAVRLQDEARGRVVPCDRDRTIQIVTNLLDNAIKFSPERGVVVLAARAEEGAVHFTVTDQGPGVQPEHLPHIFDRLWRPTTSPEQGLGLGLSIARGLVQAHGGRIWAESTPGQGSTFHFTLPGAASVGAREQLSHPG